MATGLVSVVVPVHNAAPFLQAALDSVLAQTHRPLELCVWDDCSTDSSAAIVEAFREQLEAHAVTLKMGASVKDDTVPRSRGAGYARNHAVALSSGEYLCFLDADDVMDRTRVAKQLAHMMELQETRDRVLLGSRFHREPAEATPRYASWCNTMTDVQLRDQRFRECTIIQPTWFCTRAMFDHVGGYDETGVGTPEDLLFFYALFERGCQVARHPADLVMYRHVANALSSLVNKETIWAIRMRAIQAQLLDALPAFGIWSAGRDGKKFYRSLSLANQAKVTTFYDVDERKIAGGIYWDERARRKVPIVHFRAAQPPFVLCVKLDLHAGFEDNVASLGLQEGTDYWHFC
eukprot:m.69931 g.69931  ORF g.69931 m.69931 type:complete len:348 (-) comp7567_c0_seq2:1467-2510(-)